MDDTLLADGLEDAFIGFFQRINEPRIVVYDYEKCIKILMDRDGMEEDEADECLQFNTVGAWVGKGTNLVSSLFTQIRHTRWIF